MCNSTTESLQTEIATLKARINTLEQEKIVAESNVADLVNSLASIQRQASNAIKS